MKRNVSLRLAVFLVACSLGTAFLPVGCTCSDGGKSAPAPVKEKQEKAPPKKAETESTVPLIPQVTPAGKEAPPQLKEETGTAETPSETVPLVTESTKETVEEVSKENPGELSKEVSSEKKEAESLAPYVPTPHDIVKEMLKLAKVTKDDVVYDLGCGDGRIVITAAELYGARGVGVELDKGRYEKAKKEVSKRKLDHLVTIENGDLLQEDLTPATVVTLYLLPDANRKLKPKLEKQLRKGARVVSHDFSMPGWQAAETVTIKSKEDDYTHTIYVYQR